MKKTGNELLDAFDDPNPTAFLKYFHEFSLSIFGDWFFKSRNLAMACRVLEIDIMRKINIGKKEELSLEIFTAGEIYPVYLMLLGLRLEVFLKGCLILFHKKWSPHFRGHDLLKLCQLLKIKINEDDKKFLIELSKFIEWAGKYPSPLVPEKYLEHGSLDGFYFDYFRKKGIAHLLTMKNLVEDLEKRLNLKIKKSGKKAKKGAWPTFNTSSVRNRGEVATKQAAIPRRISLNHPR